MSCRFFLGCMEAAGVWRISGRLLGTRGCWLFRRSRLFPRRTPSDEGSGGGERREDSGSHQDGVFNLCSEKGIRIVVGKRIPVPLPGLPTEPPSFETRAKVLATNHREIPEWVVDWYNPRGDVSGNRIKELAIGDTQANAAFFRIGALADGLFLLFRGRILSETFARARMQTVRWQVCQIAGRAVRHAGALPLKVAEDVLPFFQALRERSYRLMGPQGVA